MGDRNNDDREPKPEEVMVGLGVLIAVAATVVGVLVLAAVLL